MLTIKKEFIKSKEMFWNNMDMKYDNDSKDDNALDDTQFHGIKFSEFECDIVDEALEKKVGTRDDFNELLESYLKDHIPNEYKGHIKLDEDKLLLSHQLWRKLFDYCIDNIIRIVNECVRECNDLDDKPIDYICLVGGFAESKYYRYKMKQSFGNDYSIKIPDTPLLSVVK